MVPVPLPEQIELSDFPYSRFLPLSGTFLKHCTNGWPFFDQSSTPSEATPTRHHFERRLDDVKPSKTDINLVIMDYLIHEGYQAAAQKFASEANITQPSGDTENIQERVEVRNAIVAGDIDTAVAKINDLNPDLLDLDTSLHFALLRLQLIELIKKCTNSPGADITPALEFASSHLAPRAPTNPEFLSDLERTMALLIFPADNPNPQLAELLHPDLRQSVATRVNEAILMSSGYKEQTRLQSLVRLRTWAERRAREQNNDLPKKLDLWVDGDDTSKEGEDSIMSGNGDVTTEAMAT